MFVRTVLAVAVVIAVAGCARYEEWQILQKKDEAMAVLLDQCRADVTEACVAVADTRGKWR